MLYACTGDPDQYDMSDGGYDDIKTLAPIYSTVTDWPYYSFLYACLGSEVLLQAYQNAL